MRDYSYKIGLEKLVFFYLVQKKVEKRLMEVNTVNREREAVPTS